MWRDEDKNGPRSLDVPDDVLPEGDDDDDDAGVQADVSQVDGSRRATTSERSPSEAPRTAQSASNLPRASDVDDAEMDRLMADMAGKPQPTASSVPPSAIDEYDDEEFWGDHDLNAQASSSASAVPPLQTNNANVGKARNLTVEEEEAAMWGGLAEDDDLAAFMDATEKLEKSQQANPIDEDIEMQEIDADGGTTQVSASASEPMNRQSSSASKGSEVTQEDLEKREAMRKEFEEGWDDMYVT